MAVQMQFFCIFFQENEWVTGLNAVCMLVFSRIFLRRKQIVIMMYSFINLGGVGKYELFLSWISLDEARDGPASSVLCRWMSKNEQSKFGNFHFMRHIKSYSDLLGAKKLIFAAQESEHDYQYFHVAQTRFIWKNHGAGK